MSEDRLDRREEDLSSITATLDGLAPVIHRIDAQIPHLATKAELERVRSELKDDIGAVHTELKRLRAELETKPDKVFLTSAIAVLIAVLGVVLAGTATFQTRPPPPTSAPHAANIVLTADRQPPLSEPRKPGCATPPHAHAGIPAAVRGCFNQVSGRRSGGLGIEPCNLQYAQSALVF